MSEAGSRVRWSPEELAKLAGKMAADMSGQPRLSLLSALRQAQDAVLREERRREVKAWSVVQPRLEPLLVAAQERLASGGGTQQAGGGVAVEASGPVGDKGEQLQLSNEDLSGEGLDEAGSVTAADGRALEVREESTQPAPASKRSDLVGVSDGELGARMARVLESALLVALQSPQVEDAFTKVMGRALVKATESAEQGSSRKEAQGERSTAKVLVAGFTTQASKSLEDHLKSSFDVRSWNPAQGSQMLEMLTRMCSVAVIPEEADEEMGEELRGREMMVVRHAGSVERLSERLSTMLI